MGDDSSVRRGDLRALRKASAGVSGGRPLMDGCQGRIRAFVESISERGGFEAYWVRLHGDCLNRTEKDTIMSCCSPDRGDAVVLDAGCGEGRLTALLAEVFSHVYAIDFSERSADNCRQKALQQNLMNVTVHCHDLREKINIRQVDTVVLVQVLQHLDNEEERILLLRRMWECLKVGGKLVLTVFNHDRLWNRIRSIQQDVYQTAGYPYFHYFRIEELRRILHAAGFGQIKIRGCINLPATIHESSVGNLVGKLDVSLAGLSVSRYLGIYLLATAERATIR